MAAALFSTSCQYIGSQVAFSQNQYHWFFFSEGFPIHPRRGESPAQCCTAGWFARRATRAAVEAQGLPCHHHHPARHHLTQAQTPTQQESHPSWLQDHTFLKTQSTPFPVLEAHCTGTRILYLHSLLSLSPFLSFPPSCVSLRPSQHTADICVPQPALHTQLQEKRGHTEGSSYLQNRNPSQTLKAITCLAMTSA